MDSTRASNEAITRGRVTVWANHIPGFRVMSILERGLLAYPTARTDVTRSVWRTKSEYVILEIMWDSDADSEVEHCDVEEALRRERAGGRDNMSAYYCQNDTLAYFTTAFSKM
jgi:hypothetical protein